MAVPARPASRRRRSNPAWGQVVHDTAVAHGHPDRERGHAGTQRRSTGQRRQSPSTFPRPFAAPPIVLRLGVENFRLRWPALRRGDRGRPRYLRRLTRDRFDLAARRRQASSPSWIAIGPRA